MIGLIILAIVGLWFLLAFLFTLWMGRRFVSERWRWPVGLVMYPVLLLLPVVDELVARPQIEQLCREGAVLKIDEQKIKGRRVKYSAEPLNADVPGTAIPVTYTKAVFRDAGTDEELGSRGRYVIAGGWLIRKMSFSESTPPLFARAYCAPSEGEHDAANRLGFKIIN